MRYCLPPYWPRALAGILLSLFALTPLRADIPWAEVEKRVAAENAALAARPGGHAGQYFVVCTLYYTPMESGFTPERGFDQTTETRPGLGGRKYPREFLASVKKEGIGRMAAPVNGLHYMRYEGNGRYGFCSAPTGLGRAPITPRQTAAVRSSALKLFRQGRLLLEGPEVVSVFGSREWKVGDTGGGLRKWQIDLYWGEDEPMGPGRQIARPRGTTFEYGYALVTIAQSQNSQDEE